MTEIKIDVSLLDNLKRNIVVLLIVPLILIGIINITYAQFFDAIIEKQNLEQTSIFELNTQFQIFKNDFRVDLSKGNLPLVVRDIGYNSVFCIYILLVFWLASFSISNYVKLSLRQGSKFLILLEILLMVVVFTFSVKPGMGVLFSLLGYLIFLMLLTILLFYWLEGNRNKQ